MARRLPLALLILQLFTLSSAQLRQNFYAETCPQAESIIASAIQSALANDTGLAAKMVRLHFHDCFVQGCDGSVLLDATDDDPAEKDAGINDTLGGFDLVDTIKELLEAACPGTVSCADLLAIAARDSVYQTGGPLVPTKTGRRDGFASNDPDATGLPLLVGGVNALINKFAGNNLSTVDMIALSGAHTIGIAHCENLQSRVAPFKPKLLRPDFYKNMSRTCIRGKRLQDKTALPLDVQTRNVFDSKYFQNILAQRGLLITDSILSTDQRTLGFVQTWANDQNAFFKQFSASLVKMSEISVLTGGQGEIRFDCRATNQY